MKGRIPDSDSKNAQPGISEAPQSEQGDAHTETNSGNRRPDAAEYATSTQDNEEEQVTQSKHSIGSDPAIDEPHSTDDDLLRLAEIQQAANTQQKICSCRGF